MIRVTDRFTFFFRPDCPFSQWYPATFVLDEQTFSCAEQAMMYGKAVLFGDAEVAEEILASDAPGRQKALGRKVRGFREDVWRRNRETIVYRASLAKFSQNADLASLLLATAPTRLVEASPYDRIWGVGLAVGDRRADNPANWRGANLLGEILTRVRDVLGVQEAGGTGS